MRNVVCVFYESNSKNKISSLFWLDCFVEEVVAMRCFNAFVLSSYIRYLWIRIR